MNEKAIIHSVPAASELHSVPGFNPMDHLRKTTNANGQPVMQLDPRYQRLWFRLACPKGRMLLNPMRITDQMAIFEAKVYFHRDDPTPASSFTANKTAQETPAYIRAAQDEALKEALDNAGFGIQLCDVTHPSNKEKDGQPDEPAKGSSSAPAVKEEAPAHVQPAPASATVQHGPKQDQAKTDPTPAQVQTAPPTAQKASPAPVVEHSEPTQPAAVETPPVAHPQAAPAVEEPAPEPAPVVQPAAQEVKPAPATVNAPIQEKQQAESEQNDTAPGNSQQSLLAAVLQFPAQAAKNTAQQGTEAPASVSETTHTTVSVDNAVSPRPDTASQPTPGYTNDMTVEEICGLMTLEEAQAIVVPKGPCGGWTMAQVAERRPSSLQFYLTKFCECGNIQKAAATLLIQDLQKKKAG